MWFRTYLPRPGIPFRSRNLPQLLGMSQRLIPWLLRIFLGPVQETLV